jgi:hypothetical protein
MLPLSEPELEHSSGASQRVIKAWVTFSSNQRYEASCHDVRKTKYADDVDGQKQTATDDQPIVRVR